MSKLGAGRGKNAELLLVSQRKLKSLKLENKEFNCWANRLIGPTSRQHVLLRSEVEFKTLITSEREQLINLMIGRINEWTQFQSHWWMYQREMRWMTLTAVDSKEGVSSRRQSRFERATRSLATFVRSHRSLRSLAPQRFALLCSLRYACFAHLIRSRARSLTSLTPS